jgi:hypothetical protein
MKSGRCPRRQSTDIRVGPTGTTRDITTFFSASFWRKATPERHVCVSCRYLEQYVGDPVDRRAIAEKWPGGSLVDTQNRPLVDTSNPAISNSGRDVDVDDGTVVRRRDGQRLSARQATANRGVGAAGLVASAH